MSELILALAAVCSIHSAIDTNLQRPQDLQRLCVAAILKCISNIPGPYKETKPDFYKCVAGVK